jgi:hypothetical protein
MAPAPSIHQSPKIAEAETATSKSVDAVVGAWGMKLRKRGWLTLTQAGARTSRNMRNASSAPSPSSVTVSPVSRSRSLSAAGAFRGWA